jgi:hypothetical protein
MFHAIDLACQAILMGRDKPVRIWLNYEHIARLFDGQLPPNGMPRLLRFRGLPITIACVPCRSRVVGASGIVEYV